MQAYPSETVVAELVVDRPSEREAPRAPRRSGRSRSTTARGGRANRRAAPARPRRHGEAPARTGQQPHDVTPPPQLARPPRVRSGGSPRCPRPPRRGGQGGQDRRRLARRATLRAPHGEGSCARPAEAHPRPRSAQARGGSRPGLRRRATCRRSYIRPAPRRRSAREGRAADAPQAAERRQQRRAAAAHLPQAAPNARTRHRAPSRGHRPRLRQAPR